MAPPEPPIDETVWAAPEGIAQLPGGSINTNSVLHYFSWSPFYEPTSVNATIISQAGTVEEYFHAFYDRQRFEASLKRLPGRQYTVIEDPSEGGSKVEHSGVWVIREQELKTDGEIIPMRCYIVMGHNIFVAPSLGDILGGKMISTMVSLNKLFSTASTLPLYTPALGHTWFPPTAKPVTAAINARPGQGSREGTPLPGTPAGSVSSSKPPLAPKNTSGSGYQDLQTLAESYRLSQVYGNEYMDENPLVGEPGSFRITKTKEVVPKPVLNVVTPFSSAPVDGKTAESPVALKKIKGADKSPITPGTKEKKNRRKSKAAGVTTTTTPK